MKYILVWMLVVLGSLVARPAFAEEPVEVSACQLVNHPDLYNHRRVKVTGEVTRGFEDFTLHAGNCNASGANAVWLELGGRAGSQVVYCCGVGTDAVRAKPLVVEGVETTLRQDATLQEFQRLTHLHRADGRAHATLVGRFFAGKEQEWPAGRRWGGYGHMGFFSLLVIEEVADVTAS